MAHMNTLTVARLTALGAAAAVLAGGLAANAKPLEYTGINLSGGEFYTPKAGVRPNYGTQFVYPSQQEFDYFIGKGMNVFRVGCAWETLQPAVNQPLDPVEVARLKATVEAGTHQGAMVLIDPHNGARFFGKVIGSPDVSAENFANFWGQLALAFKNNPRVWFGLMNEPYNMPVANWRVAANDAIAAIRKTGAKNLILVPGDGWTSAWIWNQSGNNTEMLKIKDPDNNYVFEVHQYLDVNSSGEHYDIEGEPGSARLKEFTDWCTLHHKRGFLGEFAAPASDAGKAATEEMLDYMEANSNVWLGYTWWSAGAWWGNYPFSLEPTNGIAKPQLAYLAPHLHGTPLQFKATTVIPAGYDIYDGSLQNGWENYSWAKVDYNSTAMVHDGSSSIAVIADAFQALYLHSPAVVDATPYKALSFWINGGDAGGQTIAVCATIPSKKAGNYPLPPLKANTWTHVVVPLDVLGVTSATPMDGLWIQNNSASKTPIFYVDDVYLVNGN